jgi:hypothetical protein
MTRNNALPPSLDGLEDKWTQAWAKERVVHV